MANKKSQELPTSVLNDVLKGTQVVEDDIPAGEEQCNTAIPNISSADWTPFILSKLTKDELFDGCPTYEGLRRLAYQYLGDIIEISPDIKQTPNAQNGNHSCVSVKMVIDHPINFVWLEGMAGRTAQYGHVCDVFNGNGNDKYSWMFSSATCTTRAKASLLRDTFRLRHVYSKEELTDVPEADSGLLGYINSSQVECAKMICARLDVDARKYFIGVWKKYNPEQTPHEDLSKIPFNTAGKAIALIIPWQQDLKKIPDTVKGYDVDWINDFSFEK